MVGMSSPSAQRARSAGWNAHGEPLRSIDSKTGRISSGKRDSIRTRSRRSSLMISSWSMETGHSVTQARQLVHAQSSSSVM
jgi:hypothetical protein